MTPNTGKPKPGGSTFSDLMVRTQSAFVLVALGFGSFWIGGVLVIVLLTVVSGLMAWEIAAMHSSNKPTQVAVAVVAGIGFLSAFLIGDAARLIYIPVVLAIVLAGRFRSPVVCVLATIAIVEISLMLEQFNWQAGLIWTLWLIGIVAATDIGGYFAGKFIGGPKIAPRISPKKTWSGAVGGWVLALGVTGLFVGFGFGTLALLPATLFISMSSQLGDILESSIKRRAGVKDASNIIPGHGGLLDRFDGLLGATLVVGVLSMVGLLPVLGLVG